MGGHVVPAGAGRAMAPGYSVKLEPAPGGMFAVFEAEHPPSSPGPPAHVHRAYDEAFYVLNGSMIFSLDGAEQECPAGSFVWVPRGAVHGFRNPHDEAARLLVMVTPEAMTLVEEFFALARNGAPDPDEARALFARYDTEFA